MNMQVSGADNTRIHVYVRERIVIFIGMNYKI